MTEVLRSYKLLQILNNRHNDCFANMAFPSFIICGICVHAIDIYMCVMLHDSISHPALIFFVSWVMFWVVIQMGVYTVMGKYHEQSEELRRYCRVRSESKLDVKSVRALRPLKIQAGRAFSVSRDTALGIILIVTDVTVNAILII